MWRRVLEREVIQRRHWEEEVLRDRRRRDLESASGPSVPNIAVDFAVRMARADDGGADDDLGTFLAIVDSRTGCVRAIASETKGATDYLAISVANFVKNLSVRRFRLRCGNEPSIMAEEENVKAKMLDTVVVGSTPRRNSASNGLAERAIRTRGEQL